MRNRRHARHILFAALSLALCFALAGPRSLRAAPFTVRGDDNYPPYDFLSRGVPSGFNVDMMRAAAEVMGLDVEIKLGPWPEVRAQIEKGEIDALTGMLYSKQRARLVDFSEPLIIISYAMFVRDGSPVRGPDDLPTASIVVQQGDIMDDYAKEHYPNARVMVVESQEAALRLLSKGGCDVALLSKLQALYWIRRLELDNVGPVGPPLWTMRYCFAVAKDHPKLLSGLNEGLAILRSSGRYEEIYQKWFGAFERESALRLVLRYALWASAPVALLFAASFLWNWSLRRKVALKTEALSKALAASRESELALRESEERYRTVFDNIMDGYYRADLEGRVAWCNPAAAAMFGFEDPREAVGRNVAEIYADPARRAVFLERLYRDGAVRGFQSELRRFDGERFTAEANSRLLRDPSTGAPVGVEGVVRDITRRKRMEELMMQTEKMLSVGGLAAGMAHEINNPLGVILASCQNLSRRLSLDFPKTRRRAEKLGLDPKTVEAFLESGDTARIVGGMTEAAERAARIVRNMLDFSRKNGDKRVVCDINAALDKAVELARGDPALNGEPGWGVRIEKAYAPGPIRALINETEITQVLLNLVRNAAQALADRDGAEDRRITLRTALEGDRIRIEVEDNGPGMDETTRKRAFEPFYTTKEPGLGVGLGLSVSYFIVTQNHDGEFHLESQPGKGAKFTILLPAVKEECDREA